MKLIWNLFTHVGSLWVAWVQLLKEDAFGQSKFPKIVLGGWRLSDAGHFKQLHPNPLVTKYLVI